MPEYLRRATPEDGAVTRLEGYKEMLLDHLERTLQQADRLARQIEDIDRTIEDEKASQVEYSEEDKYVRGTE